ESLARAHENRWEAIFRNSPLPAFITDEETGEFLATNEEMLRWLGLPEESVLGRSTVELKIWSSSYMRDEILCRIQESGNLRNFEVPGQAQESPRNLLINVDRIELHGRPC